MQKSFLHHPPYLMIFVTLNSMWFNDYGLQALLDTSTLLLQRKCFVAALILGIAALITLETSLSLSAVALI